jgi:hypothetical protein
MVLLDRTHTLKVQQIQKEYQDFMERIRNKAQVGILEKAIRICQDSFAGAWSCCYQPAVGV